MKHVHDYGLRVVQGIGGAYVEVACRCGEELTGAETRRRLSATEMFNAKMATGIREARSGLVRDELTMSQLNALYAYADILNPYGLVDWRKPVEGEP